MLKILIRMPFIQLIGVCVMCVFIGCASTGKSTNSQESKADPQFAELEASNEEAFVGSGGNLFGIGTADQNPATEHRRYPQAYSTTREVGSFKCPSIGSILPNQIVSYNDEAFTTESSQPMRQYRTGPWSSDDGPQVTVGDYVFPCADRTHGSTERQSVSVEALTEDEVERVEFHELELDSLEDKVCAVWRERVTTNALGGQAQADDCIVLQVVDEASL